MARVRLFTRIEMLEHCLPAVALRLKLTAPTSRSVPLTAVSLNGPYGDKSRDPCRWILLLPLTRRATFLPYCRGQKECRCLAAARRRLFPAKSFSGLRGFRFAGPRRIQPQNLACRDPAPDPSLLQAKPLCSYRHRLPLARMYPPDFFHVTRDVNQFRLGIEMTSCGNILMFSPGVFASIISWRLT